MQEDKKYDVIFFLTATYPFGHGETFIENEINFLKKSCNHLIIVPFSERQYRYKRLQEDEKVEIIELQDSLIEWIVAFLRAICAREVWKDWLALWKSERNNFYSTVCLLFFSIKSSVRFSQMIPLLQKWAHAKNKMVYSYWAGTQAYVGQCIKKRDSAFVLITRAHGYDLYQDRKDYLPFCAKRFFAMDGIYPISEHGKNYLVSQFPILRDRVKTFYLGTKDYGLNVRKEWEIPHIISCSSMIPLKRLHLIIDALSVLKENIKWTHYGTGNLRNKLKNEAKKLPSNIRWEFKGNLSNQELMCEYSTIRIDLFLNVSESEGLPVSIMEAMSFGIPIIATRVGGIPEIVKDGINGYLLPPFLDGGTLKDTIKKFLRLSTKEKEAMRLNSRRIWEDRFSANKNYMYFYKELEKFIK